VLARSLVMATGARWRELDAEGIDRFAHDVLAG
jgi:alkyl hydroperoxide reductase subunit AhpF